MKEFKIRCSAIGQIMTNPRTNKAKEAGELSETAKSYCKMWLKSALFDRDYEFSSKYTDKGITVEDSSIEFAAEQLGWGMVFKNEEYKENEYLTGTCDLKLSNKIIDIKNAYDWATFPLFDDVPPNDHNDKQLQGYMELYDKDEAQIVYTLMDTPEHLIEREITSAVYKSGLDEMPAGFEEKIIRNHTYSDVPEKLRIKAFPTIQRDREFIKAVYQRVIECRNYIETLKANL